MSPPTIVLLLLFVSACVVTDVRTRRIPNLLSGSGMLAGAVLNMLNSGINGLDASLFGCALAMAVLLLPFALGGIGGGDVKMMGAVGAILGPRLTMTGMCCGVILGGVIMSVHLLRRGRLREKLAATAGMFGGALQAGSLAPLRMTGAEPHAVTLPYSVPLALGVLVALAIAGRP